MSEVLAYVLSLNRHSTDDVLTTKFTSALFIYSDLEKVSVLSTTLVLLLGTSAQQLDASFSTNATLEIFEVDFRDPSLDMKQKGTLPASNRYQCLMPLPSGTEEGFSGTKKERGDLFSGYKVIF